MDALKENKENVTRGCLTLNDKIYPVYDGHNTIGRNPDAVINIKNLNVSKHHSVITVFGEDTHYISDFKSANGTFLDGTKLNPLRLYKLHSGASIKLGNVFCTYKKLETDEALQNGAEESQDHSESFYTSSTQQVQLLSIPDGINFNELPTQIFTAKDLSINEMPTQIHNFELHNESSNDSIDFVTMQKASESQAFLNTTKDSSPEIPVATHSKKINDSVIDEELTQEIRPVKTAKKTILDSDSSDTEENETNNTSKSKYNISDDSETDIEDELEAVAAVQNEEKKENEEFSVASLKLCDSIDNGGEEQTSILHKKDIPVDHLYCQSFTQNEQFKVGQETSTGQEERNEKVNVLPADALQSSREASTEQKEPSQQSIENINTEQEAKKDDDIFLQPTQTLDFVTETESAEIIPKTLPKNFLKDDDDDIFLLPTQVLTETNTNKHLEKDEKGESSTSLLNEVETNENTQILDEPLGLNEMNQADGDKDDPLPKDEEEKPKEPFANEDETGENTQILDELQGLKSGLNETNQAGQNDSLQKDKEEELNTSLVNNDNLTPTQALEQLHGDDESFDKIAVLEKSLNVSSESDDLFLPPTQALEHLLSDEPSSSMSKNDDVFRLPTPLKKKQPSKEDDDSFILPPTQALEVMHEDGTPFNKVEDELHEIFASQQSLCTQQLVDVLNTTNDEEVIDDSILNEDTRLKPSEKVEPLSLESVKELLEEDVMVNIEQKNDENKDEDKETAKKSDDSKDLQGNKKKQKRVVQEKEQSKVTEQATISKTKQSKQGVNENIEIKNRRGRSAQKITANKSNPSQEEKRTNKTVGKRQNKKEPIDVTVEATTSQETEKSVHKNTRGKEVQEMKAAETAVSTEDLNKNENKQQRGKKKQDDGEQNEASTEKPVTGSKDKNTRSRRKQVETLKEEPTVNKTIQDKEEVEDKKWTRRTRSLAISGDIQTSNVGRAGRRKQNLTVDERASSVETTKSDSQNSGAEDDKHDTGNQTITRSKRNVKRKTDTGKTSTDQEESLGEKPTASKIFQDKEKVGDNKENKRRTANLVTSEDSKISSAGGRGKRKQDLVLTSDSPESEEGNKHDADDQNTTRGRRGIKRKTVVEEETETVKDNLTASKKESEENKENKKGTKTMAKLASSEGSQTSNVSRTGRRKQNLTVEEKASSGESTRSDSQDSGGAIKKQNTDNQNVPEISRPKRTIKRKTDVEPETPTKKSAVIEKTPVTTRKRGLKAPSYDSEDDFEPKISKPDGSNTSTPLPTSPDDASQPMRRLSANSRRQKREAELEKTVTTPSTLERNRRVTKPKVVFTMMDNPELESLIRQLGGSVVDTVDACTVLVTESVKRSHKLLCAVAQGKPICSPQWLKACKKAFSFVDPWDYILEDKEAEKKWNFSLRESLNRSTKAKLLEGYTFQIMVNNGADVLKGAIESCGGKCVTRNLPKCESEHLIIVSSENNKSKYSKIVQQNRKIQVIAAEAIFDGTLRQEFRFGEFLLT